MRYLDYGFAITMERGWAELMREYFRQIEPPDAGAFR